MDYDPQAQEGFAPKHRNKDEENTSETSDKLISKLKSLTGACWVVILEEDDLPQAQEGFAPAHSSAAHTFPYDSR